jgi:hypothetical protein
MRYLFYNAVPLALIVAAVYMAANHIEGWGWCIFGAIILTVAPVGKDDN